MSDDLGAGINDTLAARAGQTDVALRVRIPDREVARDVFVRAPRGADVGAVLDALAAHLGAPDLAGPGLRGVITRSGESPDRGQPFGAVGVVMGDELRLVPGAAAADAPTPSRNRYAVTVTDGPDAGTTREIGPGSHVVGRGAGCALQLTDAEVSREHLALSIGVGGVSARDMGSLNGSRVNDVPLNGTRRVAPGDRVSLGATTFTVTSLDAGPAATGAGDRGGRDGEVAFVRPPRVHRPPARTHMAHPAPPDDPQRVRVPYAAALAPLVLGIVLYLVTKQLLTLLFLGLTPIIAVWSFVEDRTSGRRRFKRESAAFRESFARFAAEVSQARATEAGTRHEDAPRVDVLAARALERRTSLWERRVADRDFMSLRVGTADLPSGITAELAPGGSEKLRAETADTLAAGEIQPGSPVLVPLRTLGAAGLCGPPDAVQSLARALTLQASVLHSPADLVIAAGLSDDDSGGWDWLKWLPHARAGDVLLDGDQIVAGTAATADLLDRVAVLAEARASQEHAAVLGPREIRPWVLLIVDERAVTRRPALARILAAGVDAGITVLWLGRTRGTIPGACRSIVEIESGGRCSVTEPQTGTHIPAVAWEPCPDGLPLRVALAQAPLRDAEGLSGPGQLPRSIALLELLDMVDSGISSVLRRWNGAARLAAPVGAAEDAPFILDFTRDGPHALLAGTTGAGKSELLRTLVASLALHLPPNRLNLLLVDYKGGSAFRECAELPHTVGMVTDLDAELARRALVSLRAEVKRRELVLEAAAAKDLAEMTRRDPASAPPYLLILVDEFATLAAEVPDFVQGLVDVAQRGRSLGVHMLLATQKPGGAVTPTIRANTTLRIALRVSDAAESEDVIDSPNAAKIPKGIPGRALARTGHSELVEFQAAHVAGRSVRGPEVDVVVTPFTVSGPGGGAEFVEEDASRSDLAAIVRLTRAAAERAGIPAQTSPWLPPLPEVIALESIRGDDATDPGTGNLVIGVLDEPALQRQRPLSVDLDRVGSLVVYGGPASGKTSLLRTLAVAAATSATPAAVNIYGLDFSSGGLRAIAGLPHCGAVVGQDEPERVARLLRMLTGEIARRKDALASAGSFAQASRRPGGAGMPRILVLIDDYGGFEAAYERVDGGRVLDLVPRLIADGRQLGVHFALTAGRRTAIPSALAGSIPFRLVLDMANRDELGMLGVDLRVIGEHLPPGRGVLDGRLQAQVALPGGDPTPDGQLAVIGRLAAELTAVHGADAAPGVGVLPTRVPRADLPPSRHLAPGLGIGDDDLTPRAVDLRDGHVLVIGPYRSGRSTALATIAAGIHEGTAGAELHLLAPRTTPLTAMDLWSSVARGVDACAASAAELRRRVEAGVGDHPLVVVIDNGEDVAATPAAADLERIAQIGRDRDVRLVAACERQTLRKTFVGWIPELRKDEHGILLDPDSDIDGDLLGARLPRMNGSLPRGRGFLAVRGEVELVQVASG